MASSLCICPWATWKGQRLHCCTDCGLFFVASRKNIPPPLHYATSYSLSLLFLCYFLPRMCRCISNWNVCLRKKVLMSQERTPTLLHLKAGRVDHMIPHLLPTWVCVLTFNYEIFKESCCTFSDCGKCQVRFLILCFPTTSFLGRAYLVLHRHANLWETYRQWCKVTAYIYSSTTHNSRHLNVTFSVACLFIFTEENVVFTATTQFVWQL